jgi:hypothetical protein
MLARSSIVFLFPLKLKAVKWVNDVMHNERSSFCLLILRINKVETIGFRLVIFYKMLIEEEEVHVGCYSPCS